VHLYLRDRQRAAHLAIAVAALAVAASGCASSGAAPKPTVGVRGSAAGTTPAPTTAVAAPPAVSTAAGGGSTTAVASSTHRTPGCLTSGIAVAEANVDDAAGHTDEQLVLTNISTRTCVIGGFPGVSYVDAHGRQLGAAADRVGNAGRAITLAPHQHAVAVLTISHPGPLPGCDQPGESQAAAGLRIYPPQNLASLVLRTGGEAECSNPAVHQLRVTAFGQP
jgi:hypothetical protein